MGLVPVRRRGNCIPSASGLKRGRAKQVLCGFSRELFRLCENAGRGSSRACLDADRRRFANLTRTRLASSGPHLEIIQRSPVCARKPDTNAARNLTDVMGNLM